LRLVGNLAHDEETSACAAASSRSSCLRFVGNRRSAPVLSCLTSGLFSLTPNSCGALICAFRRTARHTCACFTKQADAWRHAAVHTHEAPARLPSTAHLGKAPGGGAEHYSVHGPQLQFDQAFMCRPCSAVQQRRHCAVSLPVEILYKATTSDERQDKTNAKAHARHLHSDVLQSGCNEKPALPQSACPRLPTMCGRKAVSCRTWFLPHMATAAHGAAHGDTQPDKCAPDSAVPGSWQQSTAPLAKGRWDC